MHVIVCSQVTFTVSPIILLYGRFDLHKRIQLYRKIFKFKGIFYISCEWNKKKYGKGLKKAGMVKFLIYWLWNNRSIIKGFLFPRFFWRLTWRFIMRQPFLPPFFTQLILNAMKQMRYRGGYSNTLTTNDNLPYFPFSSGYFRSNESFNYTN